MSATWWGPCYTSQTGPVGSIDNYLETYLDDYELYEDNIATFAALADLDQPYSCTQWADLAPSGGGDILSDVGYGMFNLYNSGGY